MRTTYNAFWRAAYTWLADAEFRGRRYSGVPGFWQHQRQVFNAAVLTDDLNTDAVTANGQRGRIPSYTIWNATVNYTVPASGWTLFVTAKNVFDRLTWST